MPDWGLTKAQREGDSPPWGLPPEALGPGKIYTDPVHGDVHLTVLEQWIVDSPSFQRLRRIRQLGTTHLVYPGATHSRFSHALGAVRVAQELLDAIFSQREGLHPVEDLFAQWEGERGSEFAENEMAKAIVQARLGALLHDLGHVPFGHSIEDDRQILDRHDANRVRFDTLWLGVASYIENRVERDLAPAPTEQDKRPEIQRRMRTLLDRSGDLHREVEPLVISNGKGAKQLQDMRYPFVADLVGNTICADLLDYLRRDHLYTGLPVGLGRRFVSGFFVVPRGHGVYARRLALNIMRDEHERPDVVSELLKALRYRYELSERALVHHAKLAADVMISKALEDWSDAIWLEQAAEEIRLIPDHTERLAADDVLTLREALPAALRDEGDARQVRKMIAGIDRSVKDELETNVLRHGDDGLLERMSHLADEDTAPARVEASVGRLRGASASLAERLLNRDLYRVGGRATLEDAPAAELFVRYSASQERSKLERRTAEFAELGDPRSVLIWLPDPEMRMKPAGVLVDDGQTIKPFIEYEGKGRGEEIYRAHRDLWAIWAFVDRQLPADSVQMVLLFLAGELGVKWERMDRFAGRPGDWLTELTVAEITGHRVGSKEVAEDVKRLPEFAARGFRTYSDYANAVRRRLDELNQDAEQ